MRNKPGAEESGRAPSPSKPNSRHGELKSCAERDQGAHFSLCACLPSPRTCGFSSAYKNFCSPSCFFGASPLPLDADSLPSFSLNSRRGPLLARTSSERRDGLQARCPGDQWATAKRQQWRRRRLAGQPFLPAARAVTCCRIAQRAGWAVSPTLEP